MIGEFFLFCWGLQFVGCMARWAKRYQAKVYRQQGEPDAEDAFCGHLALGAIPALGSAYLLGDFLRMREAEEERKRKRREKLEELRLHELATVDEDVRKLLNS